MILKSSRITEIMKSADSGMRYPNYGAGVEALQDETYTAATDCWLYAEVYSRSNSAGGSVGKKILIDNHEAANIQSFWFNTVCAIVPCKKGSTYTFKNYSTGSGSYKFIVYPTMEN